MPTYSNSTGSDIYVQGVRLASNQKTVLDFFLESPLPSGLTKTSDTPYNYFSTGGFLFSENANGSVAYTLPSFVTYPGGYDTKIGVSSGIVEIRTDVDTDRPVFLVAGQNFGMTLTKRLFNVITVIARVNSTVASVNFATAANIS